jgi:hypothetical protein
VTSIQSFQGFRACCGTWEGTEALRPAGTQRCLKTGGGPAATWRKLLRGRGRPYGDVRRRRRRNSTKRSGAGCQGSRVSNPPSPHPPLLPPLAPSPQPLLLLLLLLVPPLPRLPVLPGLLRAASQRRSTARAAPAPARRRGAPRRRGSKGGGRPGPAGAATFVPAGTCDTRGIGLTHCNATHCRLKGSTTWSSAMAGASAWRP